MAEPRIAEPLTATKPRSARKAGRRDKPREITLKTFKAELKAQGVERIDLIVICPLCDTPQSMRALIAAGAGATEADIDFADYRKGCGDYQAPAAAQAGVQEGGADARAP